MRTLKSLLIWLSDPRVLDTSLLIAALLLYNSCVSSIRSIVGNCGGTSDDCVGKEVSINGWVHNKRDHGQIFFTEIRDHTGIIQCVCNQPGIVEMLNEVPLESVVQVAGTLQPRPRKKGAASEGDEAVNLDTVEIHVTQFTVISKSQPLPFEVNRDNSINDELKHTYRPLYLRRQRMLQNLRTRADIMHYIREGMRAEDSTEIQTPIITAPSPEGARDFLVSSYKFPGRFYALPQAPQQFKQMAMVAGIGRYFQIAPCFRNEDSRADRLPGEFYQLDLEVAFASQQEIFDLVGKLVLGLFNKFNEQQYRIKQKISKLTYQESIQLYGTDKPDLRNPLQIYELSDVFKQNPPEVFSKAMSNDGVVLGIIAPDYKKFSTEFFEQCRQLVVSNNGPGVIFLARDESGLRGSIATAFTTMQKQRLEELLEPGNGIAMISMFPSSVAYRIMGLLRNYIGEKAELIEHDKFEFVWITDFPMYEQDVTGKVEFAHNPFSKPKGGLRALTTYKDSPSSITAMQYDLVCNGYEVGSGAIRNDSVEGLYKAFEIVGYSHDMVDREFSGLVQSFKFGVPPHGGIALGLDRLVMLLTHEPHLREVQFMPLNQSGEDKFLNAPRRISQDALRELGFTMLKRHGSSSTSYDASSLSDTNDTATRADAGTDSETSAYDIESNFKDL